MGEHRPTEEQGCPHTFTHVGMKGDIWSIQPASPLTSLRSDGLDPDSRHPSPAPRRKAQFLHSSVYFKAHKEKQRGSKV